MIALIKRTTVATTLGLTILTLSAPGRAADLQSPPVYPPVLAPMPVSEEIDLLHPVSQSRLVQDLIFATAFEDSVSGELVPATVPVRPTVDPLAGAEAAAATIDAIQKLINDDSTGAP